MQNLRNKKEYKKHAHTSVDMALKIQVIPARAGIHLINHRGTENTEEL